MLACQAQTTQMHMVLMLHLVRCKILLVQLTARRKPYQRNFRRELCLPLQQPQRGEHPLPLGMKTCWMALLDGPSRPTPGPDASQDIEEDDFEPAKKRPRPKNQAHKDPKSKKSLLPSIQEEVGDGILGKINSRCKPKDVLNAIISLSVPQKARLSQLGWGKFLETAIDCLESRNLFLWLLDRVDTMRMLLLVPPNIELPINKEAVYTVLGVPAGTEGIPKKSSKELSIANKTLMEKLGIETNKIKVTRLLEEVAKGKDDDLSIICFFLVIFNKFLFCSSAYDIVNSDFQYIVDFDKFVKVDWQQAVIDHIRIAAKEWQSPEAKNTSNPTIISCAPFRSERGQNVYKKLFFLWFSYWA